MRLTDTDLNVSEREWVERVLQPEEELLLVCKPQARLWRAEYVGGALFAIVWVGIVGMFTVAAVPHVLSQVLEKPAGLLLLLFLLPFWLVSAAFVMSPWRNRTVEQRTLYLVTNRRAVVLAPSFFRLRPTQKDYPLVPDMIREVKERADGSGDVVLDYEERSTKHGSYMEPVGFLRVPQVSRVAAILREQMPKPPPVEELIRGVGEPFTLSDEAPPAEFPNVLTLLVGGFFMFIGGSQIVSNVEPMLAGVEPMWWGTVIFGIGWPLLFFCVGGTAVLQWYRDFRKYRRSKR